MKKLVTKLVKYESDKNHPEEIKKCFDFVVNELKKAGLKIKIFNHNSHLSLIAAHKIKKHYHYILNGHLDVVPASYKDAYKPIIKGNRLYGRGASDMKGPDAALIETTKIPLLKKVDFALILNTDEEIGGTDGVRYLLEDKGYSCDCVIIPDGGDNFQLTLGEKGVLHIQINARGKTAHGSRPWLGENALDKLIRIYLNIKKSIPQTTKNNRWLTTVNLGVMRGGDATNKICDSALVKLDFRYPKKVDRSKIINLVEKEVKKEKGVKYQIIADGSPLVNNPQNKYFLKLKKIAKKHQQPLQNYKAHGASDGRYFSEKGIPVIMFKPVCSEPHIDHEWIDLESLKTFQKILKDFLLSC